MSEQKTKPAQPENTIERHGNIATIIKPEGRYSIMYGLHIEERQEIIPAGVDGICFEWVGKYPATNDELQKVAVGNQKPIFRYAERNKLPLLATDCSITPVARAEDLVGALELVAADYLYNKIRKKATQRGVNRREFLQMIAAGTIASYLALPLVSGSARLGSLLTGIGEEQTAELAKSAQRMHPEYQILSLRLRDVVAAQKMQFLLQNKSYKHLLATRGAQHVGIEDVILSQEKDRMDFLERLKPVLPKVLSDPETLYQINEYRVSDQGEWKVAKQLEEPNLRQLISH